MRGLVVLVGANPLPDWVVWEYLRRQGEFQAVVLACSSGARGTRVVAERLASAMRRTDPLTDVRFAEFDDPYSLHAVLRALHPALNGLNDVHVNFTGGTKVMAVAAARLAHELRAQDVTTTLSYLDPSTCTLRNEDGLGDGVDLRDQVSISFRQLCELHGIN
jgi:hypothetical protein